MKKAFFKKRFYRNTHELNCNFMVSLCNCLFMELYDRCDLLITIKTVNYETIVLNIVFDFAW